MVTNSDMAGVVEAIVDLLAFDDTYCVLVRARGNGARTLRFSCKEMINLVECGGVQPELPAFGDDLPALIEEALCAGRMQTLGDLRALAPIACLDLLDVEGTGPKCACVFWRVPGISTPEGLHRAVLDHRVRAFSGFTEKTEAWLAEVFVKAASPRSGRWAILWVLAQAGSLRRHIAAIPAIRRAQVARSFRRGWGILGDPDIVIETKDTKGALDRFLDWSHSTRIAAKGDTKDGYPRHGLQVDVRIAQPESWGATLQCFMGSETQFIALHITAKRMGLKLNEYGVWKGDERIAGATEVGVCAALRLTLSPTEFRANRGESELAANGKLPSLMTRKALRGDLHGMVSSPDQIPGLLQAADEAVSDYVGKGSWVFEGACSRIAIARKAKTRGGPSCLRLVEAEVGTAGAFALSPDIAAHCNLVIAAVRNGFDLIRAGQTERRADFERLDLATPQSRRGWLRPGDIFSKKTVGELTARLKTAPTPAMETETADAG